MGFLLLQVLQDSLSAGIHLKIFLSILFGYWKGISWHLSVRFSGYPLFPNILWFVDGGEDPVNLCFFDWNNSLSRPVDFKAAVLVLQAFAFENGCLWGFLHVFLWAFPMCFSLLVDLGVIIGILRAFRFLQLNSIVYGGSLEFPGSNLRKIHGEPFFNLLMIILCRGRSPNMKNN